MKNITLKKLTKNPPQTNKNSYQNSPLRPTNFWSKCNAEIVSDYHSPLKFSYTSTNFSFFVSIFSANFNIFTRSAVHTFLSYSKNAHMTLYICTKELTSFQWSNYYNLHFTSKLKKNSSVGNLSLWSWTLHHSALGNYQVYWIHCRYSLKPRL